MTAQVASRAAASAPRLLTCAAVALGERVERGLGLGRPVGRAGAEGAGGQRLGQVLGADLLGVVGGRLAPVCRQTGADV